MPIMRFNFFFFASFFPLLLISCSPGQGELKKYPHFKHQVITFNGDHLKPLNTNLEIEELMRNDKTLLIVLKGGCKDCHEELQFWEKAIAENNWSDGNNILIVILEKLSYLLEHEIQEQTKYTSPIYHDVNGEFIASNNLKPLIYERAAILASNNRITFLGSPFKKPKLMSDFVLTLD